MEIPHRSSLAIGGDKYKYLSGVTHHVRLSEIVSYSSEVIQSYKSSDTTPGKILNFLARKIEISKSETEYVTGEEF